jgi:hypothetical protein
MLQKMRVFLLVCLTVVLAACGGGGGDDAPNFAGNYLFSNLNLTSNNCGLDAPNILPLEGGGDTVTQNGRAISINSDGTVLTGSVDADNGGFAVSNSQTSNGVLVISTFAFRTITPGSNYQVTFTSNGGACSLVYTGTATKV